jgi:hypothetical protein
LPMPLVEPVMTATLPFMSNKLMASLPFADPAMSAPVMIFEAS